MTTTRRTQRLTIATIATIAVLSCIGGVVAIGALGDDPPPPASRPATEAEARDALEQVVQLGLGADPSSVCGTLAADPTMCGRLLDPGGASPRGGPITIASEVVPDQIVGGGRLQGGRLLTVCGLRTDGSTYRTQMLFWVRGGRIEILHPVWWAGNGIVTDGMTALPDGSIGGTVVPAEAEDPDERCPTVSDTPAAGSPAEQ